MVLEAKSQGTLVGGDNGQGLLGAGNVLFLVWRGGCMSFQFTKVPEAVHICTFLRMYVTFRMLKNTSLIIRHCSN